VISPVRVGGDPGADDRGSWRSGLKLPVLEPTSVPLGNIIEAKEWISVCRRNRRGKPPSAPSPAKAGRRFRSHFEFQNSSVFIAVGRNGLVKAHVVGGSLGRLIIGGIAPRLDKFLRVVSNIS
jgi:hypothetical protein